MRHLRLLATPVELANTLLASSGIMVSSIFSKNLLSRKKSHLIRILNERLDGKLIDVSFLRVGKGVENEALDSIIVFVVSVGVVVGVATDVCKFTIVVACEVVFSELTV
jgi:hypothetical protein